ncbi:MAG TPA: glycosyl transferase family 2, partial [Vicinamibacteria bacterium]|nr:glycosyl transferase family 2 [Vicinamibacteria bacterium]
GTDPLYMLASAVFRMGKRPYVTGGAAMLWGYARAAWERIPRYGDGEFRRFLRHYQRQVLLHGKRRATSALDQSCGERASGEAGPRPR